MPQHFLPLTNRDALKRARRWLMLGVLALGLAGVFAGLLANTQSSYFYTALVIHVDLSVLVWFLTMASMFFSLAGQGRGWSHLADAAFYSFAGGTLCIVASALTGGEAYMSNYIPVIRHPVFFLGLSLVFCGVVGMAVYLMTACASRDSVLAFGVLSAAFILGIAVLCFVWSYETVLSNIRGQAYYEYVFWGGGHVLQFVHTQLMLVAWLWLASASGLTLKIGNKSIIALLLLGCAAALVAPSIYLTGGPVSDENRVAFTMLMKHANGIAPIILSGFILFGFYRATPGQALLKTMLFMSILLFIAGGFLGYLIAGSNVTVPAHYHGSIVGITLAFMGVAYILLPAFGFRDVSRNKITLAQPVVYGGGQLCWMTGMAILGSHGVPRKTPGSADTVGQLAAFLKHGGDGLALIGGLLFVGIVLWSALKGQGKSDEIQY